jgi:hypothetical protein
VRQPIARGLAVFVTCAAVFALGALSRVPYTPADAENGVLRVSWRARGERVRECRRLTQEELEALPLHMRRPEVCEGRIAPYRLRVAIDGAVVEDTLIRAAGARQDRPIYVLRDFPLTPGAHAIDITFTREGARDEGEGEPGSEAEPETERNGSAPAHLALETVVEIRPGRITLVTFDPNQNALVVRSAGDRERSGS